ncbi:MAG: tripartite tricarboxylate transporter permease [Candidatus Rokuibacteriota bacterium]
MIDGAIWQALGQALSWQSVLASFVGVVLGLVVGALPGLTISLGMVLVLPLTFGLGSVPAMSLMLGLFAAGMTGGSYSAILINIPGTPSAAATTIDGHRMALAGRAGEALGVSVISSVYGGLFSLVCLVISAPLIARVALQFGAAEQFALLTLGLTLIAAFGGRSFLKGLISGVLGLLLTTVGQDPMLGVPRFAFGQVELQAGVHFIPALIGLFAIPQVIAGMRTGAAAVIPRFTRLTGLLPSWRQLARLNRSMLVGSALGTGVGAIPGTGGPIAVFLAYDVARRISRTPEAFGHGSAEGVAAPEAANNGVTGGALIPMLTLGIPGDPITAILLGVLIIQGLAPGPLLFREHADFVYGVFWSLLLANVVTLVVALASVRAIVQVLRLPQTTLIPAIAVLCVVGAYGIRNTFFDSAVMLAFGAIGYLLNRYGFPVVPMIIGLVLGGDLEEQLRLTLTLSGGDATVFVRQPIAAAFLLLTLAVIAWPAVAAKARRRH